MRYEKLLKRLKKEYPEYYYNNLITIDEIYKALDEYSKQGVFNFVNKAIERGDMKQVVRGMYSRDINQIYSIEQIAERKYVRNKNDVFGIYGPLYMEVNFLVSYQVPNSIDIISNKASRRYRVLYINGRKIFLRKSRCEINKNNYHEYTMLEFFNSFDVKQYNKEVKFMLSEYIKTYNVKKDIILKLSEYFPSKAIKNLYLSGVGRALI